MKFIRIGWVAESHLLTADYIIYRTRKEAQARAKFLKWRGAFPIFIKTK